MYRFECVCGKDVSSASVEGSCPHCERGFRLEWQGEAKNKPPVKTISEVYENG